MEQRTMTEIIKKFQPLLRRIEKDQGLTIFFAMDEPGCRAGDNYMSVVTRTKVIGKYGNGNAYAESFITKNLPHHNVNTEFFRSAVLFQNEIYTYQRLLPLLGPFGPKYIESSDDQIILQDLKPLGYEHCERKDLLDLNHCRAVVQTLAALHAKSLALKFKDPVKFRNLIAPIKEAIFPLDTVRALGQSVERSILSAIKHLESIDPKTEELKEAIEIVRSYKGRAYGIMREIVHPPSSERYHVLCHGDPWNNNFLFKYDKDGGITDVKLLDFQMPRHVSLAVDFLYFCYSSPKTLVLENHYDDLVGTYHDSLSRVLRESDVSEEDIEKLSLDFVKAEISKNSVYGLFAGVWLVGALLKDASELDNTKTVTAEDLMGTSTQGITVRPEIATRLKCLVLHYVRKFCRS